MNKSNVWILHDSKYGNGKMLSETLAKVLEEHGKQVQIGHVNDIDPNEVATNPPELLIMGGAIRMFFMSRAPKNWFKKLVKELERSNKTIPHMGVFVTHARAKSSIDNYGKRLLNYYNSTKGIKIGKIYDTWLSGKVKEMEGPFEDDVIDRATTFAHELITWSHSE